MLDIKWIRSHPEALDRALENRGAPPISEVILQFDVRRRELTTTLQELQANRRAIADSFTKPDADKAALQAESATLKESIKTVEEELTRVERELEDVMLFIPNIPSNDCPIGADESANVEVRRVGGTKPQGLDHIEIAGRLMDAERAAKMSGARFTVLYGALAKLERALAQWMLDYHTSVWGYTEVSVPFLARPHALQNVGHLPKFKDDMFYTTSDYYLISTGEVTLTNLVADSMLDELSLPLRFTAHTPCFRQEAGAAGRDTRGYIRQHQFGKVELVSITRPDQSVEEHERMVTAAEDVLKQLGLPYRVMALSTGDMGFASEKTYDIEVWLPGQQAYREISSCSRCSDFQARRMNARFRPLTGEKPQFVHTLNGSGLPTGRTLVAILENYYDGDGRVEIPNVLRPYMNEMSYISFKNGIIGL